MEKLYNNIGKKIKILAFCSFIVGAILSVVFGLYYMFQNNGEYDQLTGFMLLVFGPAVAWVNSCLLYGFGELVEHTQYIAANTYALAKNRDNKA